MKPSIPNGEGVLLPRQRHEAVTAALFPLLEDRRLLAVKVYYLASTDGHTLDVGVTCLAHNEGQLSALATLAREETELGDLRHAEHFPATLLDQPIRH